MSTKSNKRKAPIQNGSKAKRQKTNATGSFNERKVVAAPISLASKQAFKVGSFRRNFRFQNSELISTVSGTVAFNATKYSVNPGNPITFPWLSAEAVKWEQYKFYRLRFRYVTRTATTTVGSVILSPDYNIRDAAPSTEVKATDTQDAVEDACWREITCDLDPNAMFPTGPRKLVRSSNVAGDLNLYDVANLYICTVEQVGTDAIGKLWVDYDVEFFVPQNSPDDGSSPSSVSVFARASAQTFSTGVGAALDFDAAAAGFDFLGIGNDASGVFTPPSGDYLVNYQGSVSDSSAESFTATLAFQKNSAAIVPPCTLTDFSSAGGTLAINLSGIVSCNGTDTVRLLVTLTGAAGTLTAIAGSSLLTWRAI